MATVIRHRADDDQRSSVYDELLSAEARAIKNSKGLHSKKEYPLHRVADISGVSDFATVQCKTWWWENLTNQACQRLWQVTNLL